MAGCKICLFTYSKHTILRQYVPKYTRSITQSVTINDKLLIKLDTLEQTKKIAFFQHFRFQPKLANRKISPHHFIRNWIVFEYSITTNLIRPRTQIIGKSFICVSRKKTRLASSSFDNFFGKYSLLAQIHRRTNLFHAKCFIAQRMYKRLSSPPHQRSLSVMVNSRWDDGNWYQKLLILNRWRRFGLRVKGLSHMCWALLPASWLKHKWQQA